jgi:hypothetical protein
LFVFLYLIGKVALKILRKVHTKMSEARAEGMAKESTKMVTAEKHE